MLYSNGVTGEERKKEEGEHMKRTINWKIIISIAVLAVVMLVCSISVKGPETHECHTCEGTGMVDDAACEDCGGTGTVDSESNYSETFMALLPPVIAIVLALVTKEVYSALFIGIVAGGFLAANYSFTGAMDIIIEDAIIQSVCDNAGIFIFLVLLGILVALVNKAGGSQAFGRWAKKNIKSKTGASIATFVLGVMIFIDDYFNCLTVGSVMRPVTDAHKISRVKLAYLIDATAAPVCMIAPISSWAAAVSQYAPEGQGLSLFVKAIPFNFYSILTFVFIIAISIMGFDYGKMAMYEAGSEVTADTKQEEEEGNPRGRVIDLILPILILVVTCVIALIYNGGFFDPESANYHDFVLAFGDTDATVGLAWGSVIALVIIMAYLMIRRLVCFKDAMDAIPKGFIAMVPAILILTFACSLKNITGLLGAKYFVSGVMANAAAGLAMFLPAVIFLVACGLSFATGTSWGTFGILIPIVIAIFPETDPLMIVGISACLAGAICGDHCSPISDTTIMSSAGAQCNHVDHVQTQLPYAVSVAALSFVMYLVAGFIPDWMICLPVGAVLTVAFLFVMKKVTLKKRL